MADPPKIRKLLLLVILSSLEKENQAEFHKCNLNASTGWTAMELEPHSIGFCFGESRLLKINLPLF